MDLVTLGGAALRLAPRGTDRLETAEAFVADVEGAECNAAVAAGQLGAESAWYSRLPDDPLGRRVAGELRRHDVEVIARFADAGRQGVTFFERGSPPRRDGRVDDQAGAAVETLSFDALPSEPVAAADAAYVTGGTPTTSTPLAQSTARFLKTATDGGARTALGLLDPDGVGAEGDYDTLEGLFPAVDVVIAAPAAVEAVFDRSGDPPRVTHALASNHGFETVALLRNETAAVWRDSTVHEYALPPVDVVDVTGAADAFAGTFLVGLEAADVQTALRRAIAAEAVAKTMPGALPLITPAELDVVAETVERP
jgi:2-dehydro-3-deoxygluconokinase